jgi:fructokinase
MFLVYGEALLDFFLTEQQRGGLRFVARMGGSPCNVAIGLARLGVPVGLSTVVSTDFLGTFLVRSLSNEGVSTELVLREQVPTTLSFIAPGTGDQPQYAFYGLQNVERQINLSKISDIPARVTSLHFGSYSLVTAPTADCFLEIARRERKNRLISLDPNVRLTVEADVLVWQRRISEWVSQVHLVKMSREDLFTLYPGCNPDDLVRRWLEGEARLVVITDGHAGVRGFTRSHVVDVPAFQVSVVDTVGAGDAFQAAMLFALSRMERATADGLNSLSEEDLRNVLRYSSAAAALTCTRHGADLPTYQETAAF